MKSINHYLPLGGQWINFGSLVFNQKRDALCYSIDEVRALAKDAGFQIESIKNDQIPYLKSPFNAGHRVETVYSWRAIKTHHTQLRTTLQNLPAWILDIEKPIPTSREFQSFAFNHTLYAELVNKINGKRSTRQIAQNLAKEHSMDVNEAITMVKDFYLKIVKETA